MTSQDTQNSNSSRNAEELSGMVCALLSGILFGTMPLMTRAAYSLGSNAVTVAFGRFLTGAVFSGICLLLRYRTVFGLTKRQLRNIAMLSLFFSAMPCLLYGSYRYIDSGLATTLHFTYPVAVMLISAAVFREHIGRTSLICILLCVSGILLLSQSQGNANLRGMLLAAGSGVVYAVYIIGVDRCGLKKLPVLLIIFLLSVFSAIEVFFISLPSRSLLLGLPAKVWIPYTALGLIAMVIAASLFQLGIMKCGGVKSSMLSTVEPVTGVVIGVLIFHEQLNVKIAGGILLILLSVVILIRPE